MSLQPVWTAAEDRSITMSLNSRMENKCGWGIVHGKSEADYKVIATILVMCATEAAFKLCTRIKTKGTEA